MEKSFEEKVEELWNREQIRSLTYAYGECVLRRDAEGMAKLFTEDGSADFSLLGWGIQKGREDIKKFY
ncbi:MAG: nuclear transport factor 2 family protein, partial [Candidatus Acidiferrales bacterium]